MLARTARLQEIAREEARMQREMKITLVRMCGVVWRGVAAHPHVGTPTCHRVMLRDMDDVM